MLKPTSLQLMVGWADQLLLRASTEHILIVHGLRDKSKGSDPFVYPYYSLRQTPNVLLVQELGGRGLSRSRSIPQLWFLRSPTLLGMWPHPPHNLAIQALRR